MQNQYYLKDKKAQLYKKIGSQEPGMMPTYKYYPMRRRKYGATPGNYHKPMYSKRPVMEIAKHAFLSLTTIQK